MIYIKKYFQTMMQQLIIFASISHKGEVSVLPQVFIAEKTEEGENKRERLAASPVL